jgi:hypothetical protein
MLNTKDYNELVALVGRGGDLSESKVPASEARDAMYHRLVAAKTAGRTIWPIND